MHRRTRRLATVGLALAATVLGTATTALAAPVAAAAAATYYVDPTGGNDANAGTGTGTAWRSLAKVNGFAFQPGDTVLFKRGGSWSGTLTLSRSGTSASPITLGAYGSGDLPVVGGNVTDCVAVTGSYWLITEVRASGCNWAGFEFSGDHNVADTVQADANVVGVSIVDGSDFNEVRWSTIIDNNKMSVNTPQEENPDDDSGAFGFLIHGNDNYIGHNTVSGHFAASYDYVYDGAAFEIYNGNRNWIEYNVTADNDTFTELGRSGAGKTADDNVFAYNSITSTKPQGAFLVTRGPDNSLGPVRGTEALNNSVYLTGASTDGFVCYDGCSADILTLRNNVIRVGRKTGYEDGTGADEDRGVYYGPQTQFTLGANSVSADPKFVSTTDLHLQSGSPAIGRAEWLGFATDLDGDPLPATGIDAGAYQH